MVIGISCAILVVLFSIQSFGTQRIGFLFSPVVVIWMLAIGGVGIYDLWLYEGTTIIQGLSPHYIVIFFQRQGLQGFYSLGGVMLCLTGSEARFESV